VKKDKDTPLRSIVKACDYQKRSDIATPFRSLETIDETPTITGRPLTLDPAGGFEDADATGNSTSVPL